MDLIDIGANRAASTPTRGAAGTRRRALRTAAILDLAGAGPCS
jgi:hypothetical protein